MIFGQFIIFDFRASKGPASAKEGLKSKVPKNLYFELWLSDWYDMNPNSKSKQMFQICVCIVQLGTMHTSKRLIIIYY